MLTENDFPLVYLITDGAGTDENFPHSSARLLELIRAAVRAEIALVQIREKNLSARHLFDLTARAALITKNSKTRLLINSRADIALAANADGVHLPADALPAAIIRQHFPPNFIIGVSAHTVEKVERARDDGADFATFSPIFATPNKGEPLGLEKLREACETARGFPVIALGGIEESNFQSVVQTGASGFAAIRFLSDAEKLSEIVKSVRDGRN